MSFRPQETKRLTHSTLERASSSRSMKRKSSLGGKPGIVKGDKSGKALAKPAHRQLGDHMGSTTEPAEKLLVEKRHKSLR